MFTGSRYTLIRLLSTSSHRPVVEDKLVEVQELMVDVEVLDAALVVPVDDLELGLEVGEAPNLHRTI